MKIFCIGRNYVDHIQELQNEIPSSPVVFMKPATALLSDNKPFFLPDFSKDMHFEGELILRIGKTGKAVKEKFALDYIDAVSVGIDFTARDVQDHQKAKGLPWEIAKAFDHSAVVGPWQKVDKERLEKPFHFTLSKNDTCMQVGDTSLLLHPLARIITYLSQYFTLQTGDIVFTGTPKGVSSVAIGDSLTMNLEDQPNILRCDIK
mgnify:CR=1 FL=1